MTTPLTNSRLRKTLKKFTRLQTGWLDVFPAVIGKADGTIKTGIDGIIYVRNFLNGQVLTVYNLVVPNTAGLQVEVGRKVEQPGLWQVKGARETYASPAGGTVGSASHSHDDLFVGRDRFLPFLVFPIDGSGFEVHIYGDIITRADDAIEAILNQTLDLSSYVPTSGAKYVVIEADDDGIIYVNEGSTVDSKDNLSLSDIPAVTSGRKASCAVRLYDGQEQLYRDPGSINDFVDLRPFTSGGGGAVDSVNGETGTVVLEAADIPITDTGGHFTGTEVEAALQELGANQPYAQYALGDEATLNFRLQKYVDPTDGLSSTPSVTWASYTDFLTPTVNDSAFASHVAIYSTTGAAGSTRSFGYLPSFYSTIQALVSCGIDNSRAGLRMDDGTSSNYIELFLEAQSTGLMKLRYRWSNGGVESGPTDLWGGNSLAPQFYWLGIARSGNTVFLSASTGTIYNSTCGSKTFASWTPARVGFFNEHPNGASNIQRAGMFDAIKYF